MTLQEFNNKFPDSETCLKYYISKKWPNEPICPYCYSKKNTKFINEFRFHCNTCNTSFSVTVKSIFHKTHIEIRKWFLAIYYFQNLFPLSVRLLSDLIFVNKNTAQRMLVILKRAKQENNLIILE